MRRFTSLFIAFATTLTFTHFASAEVTTNPVGFESPTVGAGKLVALSVPLDRLPAFSGPVSARTATTVTTTGAAFNSNVGQPFGPFTTRPHVIRMLSGASVGRQFKIDSHTDDTLTITTGGDLTTQIAVNDRYDLLPVHTLASLFGQTAPGLLTGGTSTAVDNVLLRGEFGYLTYYNDGANWLQQAGGATPRNNVAIMPEAGFLFLRRGGTDLTLTVLGAVPTTDLKTDFPANKVTLFGNRFPVDRTLGTLMAQPPTDDPPAGWLTGTDPTTIDNVLVRGSFGWLTYYHNGSTWLQQAGGATPRDSVAIPIGASVLVVRRPGTNITINQTRPYTLP